MREVIYKDKQLVDEIVIHTPVCETEWKTYHVFRAPTVINIGEPKVCPTSLGDFKRVACDPPLVNIKLADVDNILRVTKPDDPFAEYRLHPNTWTMQKRMEYAKYLSEIPVEYRNRAPHYEFFYPEVKSIDVAPFSSHFDGESQSIPVVDVAPVAKTPANFWDALKLNFTLDLPNNSSNYGSQEPAQAGESHTDQFSELGALIHEDEQQHNKLIQRELALRDTWASKDAANRSYVENLEQKLKASEQEIQRLRITPIPAPVVIAPVHASPVVPIQTAPVIDLPTAPILMK